MGIKKSATFAEQEYGEAVLVAGYPNSEDPSFSRAALIKSYI